jgi:hypothetical protein
MEKEIRDLIEGEVVFVDLADDILEDLGSINECMDAADKAPYCIIKENGVAQLALPKHHLLSKHDNETIYVARVADELVRNERIKAFMFDTNTRIHAKNIEYAISSEEFILPQSALTPEYFSDLDTTDYYTNYETAIPSISVSYPNETIPLSEQYVETEAEEGMNMDCVARVVKVIGNAGHFWKRVFPDSTKEVVFRDTEECSFKIFERILTEKVGKHFDEKEVKRYLWKAYDKVIRKHPENFMKMCQIMRQHGKSKMFEPLVKQNSPLQLETLIVSEGYHMTDLDAWVLCSEYGLPVILFNPNGLKGFVSKDVKWLKLGGNTGDDYYFVRSNIGSVANKVYAYHMILPTFKIAKLKEFSSVYQTSLSENTIHTWKLEEMLKRTLFIKSKR